MIFAVAYTRQTPTHCAIGPNQVWYWDITSLPDPARGLFYYLYLIMDLYSRKIVAWEIHENESSDLAARLIRNACLAEGIVAQPAGAALGQWQSHERLQYAGDHVPVGCVTSTEMRLLIFVKKQ